jgi:hypothetical protein
MTDQVSRPASIGGVTREEAHMTRSQRIALTLLVTLRAARWRR